MQAHYISNDMTKENALTQNVPDYEMDESTTVYIVQTFVT